MIDLLIDRKADSLTGKHIQKDSTYTNRLKDRLKD